LAHLDHHQTFQPCHWEMQEFLEQIQESHDEQLEGFYLVSDLVVPGMLHLCDGQV